MREVDAAAGGRGPGAAELRVGGGRRQVRPAGPAGPGLRHRVPAVRPAGVADGRGERRAAPACARGREGRAPRPRGGAARAGRPRRVRRAAAQPALRRHAAAGGDRPVAGHPAEAAAHGRALRRAGRDDPRADAGRAAAHRGRDGRGGAVRHALDPRGGRAVRPGRRDVPAAGTDHGRGRRAAPAGRVRAGRSRRRRRPARLPSTPDEVVDDVRESAEFFAAVTEVREALRKGSA